ncbi:MAG TPA: SgcJ/EcaC family oxidoreductase [Leptolyngbyaceae cyanobacterium M33_DOE_097]|uniref:SgcJ/EcaC family oxidoreductase n=1 Tax=Oscillatoriales cyanobacterium SpSt-418 TaxID=2282169 RepID=A0A7C3PI30_9CYAN|nr:SgcJ/EcaC family oxidoreductase [Leptolyngbyaceae cyanobacterium M33_DOE_097]
MLLTSFGSPVIALTNDPECATTSRQLTAITQAQVAQLFDRWNAALQSGKPEVVAENYSEQAILLPTLSSQVRHNRAEITDYFRQFTALKPVGKIEEHNIQIFGDTAIDSGIYSFTGVKDNQPFKVVARYSFVYHQQGDRWLIVEHHSSLLPEQAS